MADFKRIIPPDQQNQQYQTNLPVYAYTRFSTMKQVKKSLQSKKQQDDNMQAKLGRLGFKDIRVKDKDEGISGQKDIDQRSDLADIYAAMSAGQCGGIAAYDASRIWRDRDRVRSDDFILKIKKYNVPVILYNKTYWPRIASDMEALREEFEYAQKYLVQFYDKALPAKQEAVLAGSYGGHRVPIGYAIAWNEELQKKQYVIYEPHAEIVRWLYKRYQQLDGNIGRLGRELVAQDVHFPDFDHDELRRLGATKPHVAVTHDEKGYQLGASHKGLKSILSNRAYLGWYVYNACSEESRVFTGELIIKGAHEAIVDMDDFLFAYSRLSTTKLDGTLNENKPVVNKSRNKTQALLEGVLTSNGVPAYAYSGGIYAARTKENAFESTTLKVKIADIDHAFAQALLAMFSSIELSKEAHQDIAAKVDALREEQDERIRALTSALENIEKAIRGWELAKKVAIAQESEPDLIEATRNLKRLRGEQEATQAELEDATSETGLLAECGDLLECAKNDWQGMKFEKKQRLVKLVVGCADVVEVTPHIIRLSIVLVSPLNVEVQCYIWRSRGSRPSWQEEEIEVLKKLYKSADRAVILEALPRRGWDAIIVQAGFLGLKRETTLNTSMIDYNTTFADDQLINSLGISKWPYWVTEGKIVYLGQKVKVRVQPWMGAELMLLIVILTVKAPVHEDAL